MCAAQKSDDMSSEGASSNGFGKTRRAMKNPCTRTPGNRATSFLFIAMKCVPAVSTSSKTPIQRGAGFVRLSSI